MMHAQWHLLHRFGQRQSALASDRRGPWNAEACLAGAYCPTERRWSGHRGMAETDKSKTSVWRWRERFIHEGVDGLLRDGCRPPGKAPVPPKHVAEIVRLMQAPPPHEATHWTLRAMAKVAALQRRRCRYLEGPRSQPRIAGSTSSSPTTRPSPRS